ncbi:hypothetical protein EDD86DRAFT_204564 [Gorgonomyces haynaldii]|nr:hypothetical protein EDD86DRAFT_204564 [Gorgonomyces haynaldii]
MNEREFQNMFTFCGGFEAAALKIPTPGEYDDQKKQIIGFAKFRTRLEAMEARDVLSGRKIDAEKNCVLKAEMAKKNLHTKRGISNMDKYMNRRRSAPETNNWDPYQDLNGELDLVDQFDPFLKPEELDPFEPSQYSSHSRGFSSVLYNSDALLAKSMSSMSITNFESQYSSSFTSSSPSLGMDQNPPCNTIYVGNLPNDAQEEELMQLFSPCPGYKRMSFKTRPNGPMCFVEFENVHFATAALFQLYGTFLSNSTKGGIRLSYSKNPLGVRPPANQS